MAQDLINKHGPPYLTEWTGLTELPKTEEDLKTPISHLSHPYLTGPLDRGAHTRSEESG